MTHYFTFLKKEFLESIRTYKLFIIVIIFAIFGVLSPLAAKLMPYIIENLLPDGNQIIISTPTAYDSWTQFFKNITQTGLVAIVLVFGGILVNELSKGTLINILTKGLSRSAVILAKLTFLSITWTLCLLTAFSITWMYTVTQFPPSDPSNLFFSIFCLWLFGIFLLALLLCSSTLTHSNFSHLMIIGFSILVLFFLTIFPKIQKYSPLYLISNNMELLTKQVDPNSFFKAIWVTLILSSLTITISIAVFRKKQL
jgi:ABC-2 type transport system permease protein